jgi:hypothetical protein
VCLYVLFTRDNALKGLGDLIGLELTAQLKQWNNKIISKENHTFLLSSEMGPHLIPMSANVAIIATRLFSVFVRFISVLQVEALPIFLAFRKKDAADSHDIKNVDFSLILIPGVKVNMMQGSKTPEIKATVVKNF